MSLLEAMADFGNWQSKWEKRQTKPSVAGTREYAKSMDGGLSRLTIEDDRLDVSAHLFSCRNSTKRRPNKATDALVNYEKAAEAQTTGDDLHGSCNDASPKFSARRNGG